MKKTTIFIMFLISLIFLSSCSSDKDNNTDNSNNDGDTSQEEVIPFKIGNTADFENWQITVKNISFKDELTFSSSISYKPESNKKYAVIEITVKNTGSTSATFLPMITISGGITAKILYDNTNELSAAIFSGQTESLVDKEIASLQTVNGILAYPMSAEQINSGKPIQLKIRNSLNYILFDLNN